MNLKFYVNNRNKLKYIQEKINNIQNKIIKSLPDYKKEKREADIKVMKYSLLSFVFVAFSSVSIFNIINNFFEIENLFLQVYTSLISFTLSLFPLMFVID